MSFFFPVKLCSTLLLRHQTLTTQDAFFLSRDRNFFIEWRLSLVALLQKGVGEPEIFSCERKE